MTYPIRERLEYDTVIVEKKYPVGYVTINRPERRNAVRTAREIPQLRQAFLDMRDDPEIRVFVLKGAGDNFCAGFDESRPDESGFARPLKEVPKAVEWVKNVKTEPWTRYGRVQDDFSRPEGQPTRGMGYFWEALWENPKPSICRVHSYCLGAGLMLANECDLVYATPTAVFSYPPIRYGAPIVMEILAPWLLGRRKTMEMAMTGRYITAEEAYNCGLITGIVPEDKIDEKIDEMAMSIARVPVVTNMMSKRSINNYFEGLGITQANRFGGALVQMMENSRLPGHWLDFYDSIREYGMSEHLRMREEKWGAPDEVKDRERTRLKALKAKGEAK